MKRRTLLLLLSSLLPGYLAAQGVANTSLLELTPDVQSAGMAGTGLAITDNASSAIFHNASTIGFSQEMMGVNYSYADISKDLSMHSASLFYKLGRDGKHGFTVGFRHFKESNLTPEDSPQFHPHTWDVEAGYFRNLSSNLSLSMTLRYIQANVDADKSSKRTMGVDVGVTYFRNLNILDEMASWSVGLQASNIGGKLGGQKLPAKIGVGGAIDLPFNMENRLMAAVDFSYLLPSEIRHLQASAGVEYNFLKYAVVRGGYHWGDKKKGVGNYATLGCGINYWPLHVDFSRVLAGKQDFMHRTWQLGVGITF